MRILLTNDDGIHAEGLAALERIARTLSDDVWVVAPEHDQSGFAHSLSLSDPLRLRKIGEKHYAVRGTPTDCVIMGVQARSCPSCPDLDPVRHQFRLQHRRRRHLFRHRRRRHGRHAARHPLDRAQPGLHRAQRERVVPWETAEALAPALLDRLIKTDLPPGVFLNVNFPNCPPEEVGRHDGHHARQADLRPVGRGARRRPRPSLLLAALRPREGVRR